ncbi:MAG: tetraacyldisaccharide 4'-kinase [Deltaproteobacteria bacterium]|jgi:tetraacyldisaccharide 4'-kinase
MRPYWYNLFRRLQGLEDSGPPPNIVVTAGAAVASWFYGLGAGFRRTLYTGGIFKAKRLPVPVISVGNLTVGGVGKTPVVACLARYWRDRGKRLVILSRGYGGRSRGVTRLSDGERLYHQPPEVGEEPYWLARVLPGVSVYTGPSRYVAGLAAWEDCKPHLFLLDDGFQHFQLYRDLDLVLLDAAAPFGNLHLLPWGPLRESPHILSLAQVIILTRFEPELHQPRLSGLKKAFPDQTVLTATILPVRAVSYPGEHPEPLQALRHCALMAFAGLARPQVFAKTLQELEVDLKGFRIFPDHHNYSPQELHDLAEAARAAGAEALITTSKDWARLQEPWDEPLPLWVLEVEARLGGIERPLESLTRIFREKLIADSLTFR